MYATQINSCNTPKKPTVLEPHRQVPGNLEQEYHQIQAFHAVMLAFPA
jgi:hypothetical protein